jgi:hypothetical protein
VTQTHDKDYIIRWQNNVNLEMCDDALSAVSNDEMKDSVVKLVGRIWLLAEDYYGR